MCTLLALIVCNRFENAKYLQCTNRVLLFEEQYTIIILIGALQIHSDIFIYVYICNCGWYVRKYYARVNTESSINRHVHNYGSNYFNFRPSYVRLMNFSISSNLRGTWWYQTHHYLDTKIRKKAFGLIFVTGCCPL